MHIISLPRSLTSHIHPHIHTYTLPLRQIHSHTISLSISPFHTPHPPLSRDPLFPIGWSPPRQGAELSSSLLITRLQITIFTILFSQGHYSHLSMSVDGSCTEFSDDVIYEVKFFHQKYWKQISIYLCVCACLQCETTDSGIGEHATVLLYQLLHNVKQFIFQ